MHMPEDMGGKAGSGKKIPLEMQEKWPRVKNELKQLTNRIKDIRLRGNPEPLADELAHVEKSRIVRSLLKSLVTEDRPGLKRPVAQRMASKITEHMLWSRATSCPVAHELAALTPWWIDHMPLEVTGKIRDISLDYILNGKVIPVQRVWTDVLDAPVVYMGHCVCRSSGIANDLYGQDGSVFTFTSDKENKVLLDRIMARYQWLKDTHGKIPDTDSGYVELFEKLKKYQEAGAPEYRLETLLEDTFCGWEILPVTADYTHAWIRGLHKNHKAHILNKALAFDMATILYVSRGMMFTAMRALDLMYTICSCPTPETGGGCVLTNWYYHGMSNTSILPSEDYFGRARDKDGNLLPCSVFPERAARDCMGCGCNHENPNPRRMDTVLDEADRVGESYGIPKA